MDKSRPFCDLLNQRIRFNLKHSLAWLDRFRQEPASPGGNRSCQLGFAAGVCGLSSLCGKTVPTTLGRLAAVLIWLAAALPVCPASYYSQRPDDPRAVYVAGP